MFERFKVTLMVVFFLFYPTIVKGVLSMFSCQKFDTIQYLIADMSVQCWTDEHNTYVVLAGKYSKRRRSNVAVILVRIVFTSSILFYCLLLNHSFPTNPNSITNCFTLFSHITTLQLHCSCVAILIFEQILYY